MWRDHVSDWTVNLVVMALFVMEYQTHQLHVGIYGDLSHWQWILLSLAAGMGISILIDWGKRLYGDVGQRLWGSVAFQVLPFLGMVYGVVVFIHRVVVDVGLLSVWLMAGVFSLVFLPVTEYFPRSIEALRLRRMLPALAYLALSLTMLWGAYKVMYRLVTVFLQ